jgi:hypothetical protein
MKELVLAAAFLAIGSTTQALAFASPSPSDAHPPGAIFESTPNGASTSDPRGNMVNPPVDMRVRTSPEMRDSNVGLMTRPNVRRRHHVVR